MEGLGSQNELQLMSLGFGGNDYDVSQLAESNSYQNYFLGDGNDGFHYICPPLPELIQYPQISPTYVEFLAENRVSELLGEVSHSNISGMTSGCQHAVYSLDMDFKQGLHPSLQDDYSSINNCRSAEHQILTQKPHNGISRKKTSSTESIRKVRMAERVNALQELLPQFKEGDQATVLDDIINHINDLQGQIKDLSQHKLGGEPTCNPFISLEGHGHYLHYEQMLKQTLEEMMGKLMETNPSAAGKLLQSKGLFLMPMAIGEALH